jgi:hypothetical protein
VHGARKTEPRGRALGTRAARDRSRCALFVCVPQRGSKHRLGRANEEMRCVRVAVRMCTSVRVPVMHVSSLDQNGTIARARHIVRRLRGRGLSSSCRLRVLVGWPGGHWLQHGGGVRCLQPDCKMRRFSNA